MIRDFLLVALCLIFLKEGSSQSNATDGRVTSTCGLTTSSSTTTHVVPVSKIFNRLVPTSTTTHIVKVFNRLSPVHHSTTVQSPTTPPPTPTANSSTAPTTTVTTTTKKYHMTDYQRQVAEVLQSLGCLFLIGCVAATYILGQITNFRSFDRPMEQCQEISLTLMHVFICIFNESFDNPTKCVGAAIGIQYFTIVFYTFLCFESLKNYIVITRVDGPLVKEFGGPAILLGWGAPMCIVAVTAISSSKDYISENSCWINVPSWNALGTYVPVSILALVTIVALEAAGSDGGKCKGPETQQFFNVRVARTGMFIILPLSIAAWALGFSAVYYQKIAIYTVVFGLNVAFGVSLFIFHGLANDHIRALFKRAWQFLKICRNKHKSAMKK